jgi:hypothetical protein
VAYPGGKAGDGVFQTLINLMPPHDVYVEPFLGGAAIMRAKRPASTNIGIDVARATLEAAIRDRSSPWMAMPASRAKFGEPISPSPALAAAILSRDRQGAVSGPLAGFDGPDRIATFGGGGSPLFQFLCGDAIEFLRSTPLPPSALVYCDPPYLQSTRATRRARYDHEMTDAQHLELLTVLKRLRCRVMISGYSSTLYARELKAWNACAFQSPTRGCPAAEWVWYNFPRPVELHDYRFLGENFRKRESIKRKQRRWLAHLSKLPVLERQAMLVALAVDVTPLPPESALPRTASP